MKALSILAFLINFATYCHSQITDLASLNFNGRHYKFHLEKTNAIKSYHRCDTGYIIADTNYYMIKSKYYLGILQNNKVLVINNDFKTITYSGKDVFYPMNFITPLYDPSVIIREYFSKEKPFNMKETDSTISYSCLHILEKSFNLFIKIKLTMKKSDPINNQICLELEIRDRIGHRYEFVTMTPSLKFERDQIANYLIFGNDKKVIGKKNFEDFRLVNLDAITSGVQQ